MKSILNTVLGIGLIAAMLAAPLPALSTDRPMTSEEPYSERFPESGEIDSINFRKGEIVVNDIFFYLESNVRVITPAGAPGLRSMLKPNIRIAFNTTQKDKEGYPTVVEVLMLP